MNVVEFDDLTIAMWLYDVDNYCIEWANEPALALWESDSLEELSSRNFKSRTSEVIQENILEYRRMFLEEDVVLSHYWHFSPRGIDKQAYCHLSGFRLRDGRMGILVEALPITESSQKSKIGSSTILSTYLADGRFVSGDPTFLKKVGRDVKNLSDIVVSLSDLQRIYDDLAAFARFEGDLLISGENGESWYHVVAVVSQSHSETNKILFHQYDIHERKIGEIELTNEVETDSLTGLLNRRGFYSKLEDIKNKKTTLSLFYIDLDGFKLINDSFGHDAGDQVLKSVSQRLLAQLPEHTDSFACRFGGDEFLVGVVLPQDDSSVFFDEGLFADSMVSSLSDVYDEGTGHPMSLSASIGVASYPSDVNVITETVFFADAAMYQAKELGKRRWVKYQSGMEQSIRRRSLIAQRLFYAEQNQELMLYYQPIWDFSEGKNCIVSFEALLRWHDDELGWVPAEEIVQVAEEIGVIDNIERWVAAKALSDLLVLRDYVNPEATMAINISAVHLRVPRLPQFLLSIIEESELTPADLVIELTESALIADIDDNNNVVRRLVDSGIKISIDDFGTGYSSLAYLHHIPATTVKIDRSFAERIEHSSKTVQHIKQLIEAHGMRVLIEGVETQEQQDTLIDCGIYLHQGYLNGKPKPLPFFCKR